MEKLGLSERRFYNKPVTVHCKQNTSESRCGRRYWTNHMHFIIYGTVVYQAEKVWNKWLITTLYKGLFTQLKDESHHRWKTLWNNITAGIPQGSILGPLLFLIYANRIVDTLETHLYEEPPDDVVLMANLQSSVYATDALNRDLQKLHTWATKWHMSFNETKTKYKIISNKNTNTYGSLYLNNTELERVITFLQLGIHLDEKMS